MLPKVAHLCCAHLSNPLVTNIEYSLFKPPSMGDIHGIAARKLEILTEKPVTQPILRATFAQHACILPKKAPGFGVKPEAGSAIYFQKDYRTAHLPCCTICGYAIEGRRLSSIVGTAIPFGGLTQNNLIPLNLALHHFLAKQAVKQHTAGCAPQLLGIVLHCGHRGRDTGQH